MVSGTIIIHMPRPTPMTVPILIVHNELHVYIVCSYYVTVVMSVYHFHYYYYCTAIVGICSLKKQHACVHALL